MRSLFLKLQRRNVFRAGALYAAAAWLAVQIATQVFPFFDVPNRAVRWVVVAAALGFPVALLLAWFYEFTPRGLKRESDVDAQAPGTRAAGRTLDRWIIAVLAAAVVLLLANVFVLPTGTSRVDHAAPGKSIAVLPFENLSADAGNAYFASGMQEMILTKLAGVGDLKVISRSSTEKYDSHPDDLKAIAQRLGVGTFLEGSVQKAGNSVLVNVQLIDAQSSAHLWAEAYQRTLDNVFTVEGDVAQKVADALQTHLSAAQHDTLGTPPTRNAEAHDLYLQGGYYLRQVESGNGDPAVLAPKALAAYREATLKDPAFAQAFAQMAYVHALLYWFRIEIDQADIDEAERLADHALALDPRSAEAHIAKGYVVYWGRRDYARALAEFAEAQRLQPNAAGVLVAMAFIYRRQGDWQASLDAHVRGAALDPGNAQNPSDMGYTFALLRRYAEAEAALNRSLAINPEFWDALSGRALVAVFWKGDTKAARGLVAQIPDAGPRGSVAFVRFEVAMWARDFDAALAALDGAPERIHTNPGHDLIPVDLLRAQALDAAGRAAQARTHYEAAIRRLENDAKQQPADPSFHAFLGRAYAGVGRTDEAVREGRRAVELRPVGGDAFSGPFHLAELAKTYARLGNADEAIPLIRQLLAIPAGLAMSLPVLKMDPVWDPIRQDPRFRQLTDDGTSVAAGAAP